MRVFDEAFQSRIHVSLRYADLSSDAKRQIWVAFLKRVNGDIPNGGLSYDDLRTLAEKKVNGRQIKNIVKTAGALAQGRQERLGFDHLDQVLDLMEQFDTACVFLVSLLAMGALSFHQNPCPCVKFADPNLNPGISCTNRKDVSLSCSHFQPCFLRCCTSVQEHELLYSYCKPWDPHMHRTPVSTFEHSSLALAALRNVVMSGHHLSR